MNKKEFIEVQYKAVEYMDKNADMLAYPLAGLAFNSMLMGMTRGGGEVGDLLEIMSGYIGLAFSASVIASRDPLLKLLRR